MADYAERLAELTGRLAHLATLRNNWDSHQGVPPALAPLNLIRDLLAYLAQSEHIAICPGPNGDLSIERHADGEDVELYVEADLSGAAWRLRGGIESDAEYEQVTRADVLAWFGLEGERG